MTPVHPRTAVPLASPGAPARPRDGAAFAAPLFGVGALALTWTGFGGILLGLLALFFGVRGLLRKRRGSATRGVLPVIGAALGALAVITSSVALVAGVAVLDSEEFRTFSECVDAAGSQAEEDRCAEEFDRSMPG